MKTPCVNVCVMNAERGVCTGCYRTLDEIARWSAMSDAERDRVMAQLPARRADPAATATAQPLNRPSEFS